MFPFVRPSRRAMLGAAISAACGAPDVVSGKLMAATAPVTTKNLPIPPRLQWDELGGYCGECSIQQAALYFGTYVSQYASRAIINPNQKSQLLVGMNDQAVLSALRLKSAEFNFNQASNQQFAGYFGWVKQHLKLNRPVMITAYVKGLNDPDYDHIMLATGFTSSNSTSYLPTDRLFFNDCFNPTRTTRIASTLPDNRRMRVNGARYEFCIPANVCYGCAITGIQDTSGAALPVRIQLADWSEPDVMAGEAPIMLAGTVSVSGLTAGDSYSLYRYNSHQNVPTANYARSNHTSAVNFVANTPTVTFPVTLSSNGVAVFRCLPAGI
jgi:hypothetical protein